LMEQAQAQSNIAQTQATVEGEIQKDVVEHEISLVEEQTKTGLKIAEISASASAKIKEAAVKTKATNSENKDA
jgi:hypothetical protein